MTDIPEQESQMEHVHMSTSPANRWKPICVTAAVIVTLLGVFAAAFALKLSTPSISALPVSKVAVAKVAFVAPMTVDSPRGTSNDPATMVVNVIRGEGLSQTGSRHGTSLKKMLVLNPKYKQRPDFVPLNAQLVVLAPDGASAPTVNVVNTAYAVSAPKPAPATKPAPAPKPKPAHAAPAPKPAPKTSGYNGAVSVAMWDKIAQKESSGNWQIIDRAGRHFGGLQFLTSTWLAYGGGEFASRADKATKDQQMTVAMRVLTGYKGVKPQGWKAWSTANAVGAPQAYPQFI